MVHRWVARIGVVWLCAVFDGVVVCDSRGMDVRHFDACGIISTDARGGALPAGRCAGSGISVVRSHGWLGNELLLRSVCMQLDAAADCTDESARHGWVSRVCVCV